MWHFQDYFLVMLNSNDKISSQSKLFLKLQAKGDKRSQCRARLSSYQSTRIFLDNVFLSVVVLHFSACTCCERGNEMSHCRGVSGYPQQEWCSAHRASLPPVQRPVHLSTRASIRPVQPFCSRSASPWSSSSSFSSQSPSLSSGFWPQEEMTLFSWALKEVVQRVTGETKS